ncbi:SMI1/KNR4 family protein [Streptomyces parvus]
MKIHHGQFGLPQEVVGVTSERYVDLVFAVLGEPSYRYADVHAWRALEADLGCALPGDYKCIVDAYAPVQISEHLYLSHPFPERWNLRDSIRRTSDSWAQVVWDDDEKQGAPWVSLGVSDLTFGTADGLIPLVATDRGETVFHAPRGADGAGVLFVEDGEGEFLEFSMGFAEWMYRYLTGEEMAGAGSAAFYPGPVTLRDLPMAPGDRPQLRHGPARGV